MTMFQRRFMLFHAISAVSLFLAGCVAPRVHRHERDQFGHVFYLDGAGGGNSASPWASGVEKGLGLAKYPGDFYCFPWNTGLGVGADQGASVEYKRQKAAELAKLIREYIDEHPGAPVSVIGLSAGTAVAVFTLEALPPRYAVDDIVLLGSSLSAHYDITHALKHVRNRFVVYTSEKDAVLGVLVSIAGTADRMFCGACAAGLRGFHWPPDKSKDPAALALYRKVENIDWKPEFAQSGNYGGHTDTVGPRFIRDYVASKIMFSGPAFTLAAPQPSALDDAKTPTGTGTGAGGR